MSFLKKATRFVVVLAVLLIAIAGAAFYHWAHAPLTLHPDTLDITVLPHSSLRSVAAQLESGGLPADRRLFEAMTRLLGRSTSLKSGNYEFKSGVTPYQALQKVARGDVNQYVVTIIEGWTFARMRAELDDNPMLRHDTREMSEAQILAALNAPQRAPEGLFFPDTYLFPKGTSDIDILSRAYRVGRLRLAEAWRARAPGLPYQNEYEALIMASLVEKETGRAGDRAQVAAVFVNRLRVGMPLQTDPSVIYGMGASYRAPLARRDLSIDSPYNTYTRGGLPPTPIALPGVASLEAALHPADTRSLYFVARGDGSSEFSTTLEEHNRAVNRYLRGK